MRTFLTGATTFVAILLLLSIIATSVIAQSGNAAAISSLPKSFSGGVLPVTKFLSTNAYTVHGKTPKGGVDAFSYDGSGHIKLKAGEINVDVDPLKQTGSINATWVDNDNNNWSLTETKFMPGMELYFNGILPNGTASMRLGNDSIAINHWEHGNTGAGPPVLPTVFTYVATWGPADVSKNGQKVGTFDAHMMVTDGVRDPISGKVLNSNKSAPYNPMNPADGYSNPNTAQVHLIFQSPMGNMTNNFPPQFQMMTHLMFYDIKVQ